uniref:Isopropylmalate dehydrogenase-like domain-containing protein n=1 Tax=Coturnix japonica TaxID=93934 RepID=A0A8C2T495_COTJA
MNPPSPLGDPSPHYGGPMGCGGLHPHPHQPPLGDHPPSLWVVPSPLGNPPPHYGGPMGGLHPPPPLSRHACVPVDFEEVKVGAEAPEDDVHNAIMAIRRNGVALKGTTGAALWGGGTWGAVTSLDLYANVIHCRSLPGVETRHRDIDILIVRENTEGEYSSLEHESVSGVVESLKIITAGRSRRIAHYAFRLARSAGRRRVTAVHKANIMKLGDGLFLQCCQEVAAEYPEISFNSMIVDNTTMQVGPVFDVMVMPNLYGNIVNNVCAGLVGGPGLVPGANYGMDYAVFETSIANRNIANRPTAALLAACMMPGPLRLHTHASSIRQAVLSSLDDPRTHTPDIGGQGTTSGAGLLWGHYGSLWVHNGRY